MQLSVLGHTALNKYCRVARIHARRQPVNHCVVGELFNARETGMEEFVGATGKLFLTTDGRVHRKLAWARFERGQPAALPDTDEFQGLFEDIELDFDDVDGQEIQNFDPPEDRFGNPQRPINLRNE